jgi:hypothetical protein
MPLKRHPALQDLSREHQLCLIQAREIRWHVEGNRWASPLPAVVAEFQDFWHKTALRHFEEEEQVLLPLYGRHVDLDQDPGAQEMLADHAWLRANVARLEQRLDEGQPLEALLEEIGQRLYDHVRFEERELFEEIQQRMPESALIEYQRRASAFRES